MPLNIFERIISFIDVFYGSRDSLYLYIEGAGNFLIPMTLSMVANIEIHVENHGL